MIKKKMRNNYVLQIYNYERNVHQMFYNYNLRFWYKNTNKLTFSGGKQFLLGITTFSAVEKHCSELIDVAGID